MVHEKKTHGARGEAGRRGSGKTSEGWTVSHKRAAWQRPGTMVAHGRWAAVARLGTAFKRPPFFGKIQSLHFSAAVRTARYGRGAVLAWGGRPCRYPRRPPRQGLRCGRVCLLGRPVRPPNSRAPAAGEELGHGGLPLASLSPWRLSRDRLFTPGSHETGSAAFSHMRASRCS